MQKIIRGENIIEVGSVSFSYGDDLILDKINFNVRRGDYVGIIGPNGGGKTTLLKIILGLIHGQGNVKLFSQDINYFKDWSKIGYVSQKATQIESSFPMTVYGVVSMGRYGKKSLLSFPDGSDREKVTRALKDVEMEEYQDRLIGDLSGGQQQRVFIARALAGEPEVVIFDEPTAGIDLKTREQLYDLLRKLNHEMRLTLVLVSHDLAVMEREATELLCVDRKLLYRGSAKKFRASKSFSDLFEKSIISNHHL